MAWPRCLTVAQQRAGAELDAGRVLEALPEGMPLGVAAPIVARMLCTAMHARRSAAIARNLNRSLHLSTAATRAEVRAQPTQRSGGDLSSVFRPLPDKTDTVTSVLTRTPTLFAVSLHLHIVNDSTSSRPALSKQGHITYCCSLLSSSGLSKAAAGLPAWAER